MIGQVHIMITIEKLSINYSVLLGKKFEMVLDKVLVQKFPLNLVKVHF